MNWWNQKNTKELLIAEEMFMLYQLRDQSVERELKKSAKETNNFLNSKTAYLILVGCFLFF